MSAIDTFEWIISTIGGDADPRILKFVKDRREYLLTMRSEDERQRFVDEVIEELHAIRREASGL